MKSLKLFSIVLAGAITPQFNLWKVMGLKQVKNKKCKWIQCNRKNSRVVNDYTIAAEGQDKN